MKIGVFDSGKGGTTVLEAIKRILPEEEYYYIADSKNCPYGNKTKSELLQITSEIVDELKGWGAEIVVIACNTATTNCIEDLRKKYPELRFVGVEPAIKLATNTGARKILVMATPGTIESERTVVLLNRNKKSGQEIELLPCPGLAEAIENSDDIQKTLENVLKKVLAQANKYDCVVLGCTHYPLIKDKIQRFFPNALMLDGGDGTAMQVKRLVENLWKNE